MFPRHNHSSARTRRGLTLAELLISIAVLGMLAGGLAALAMTVSSAGDVSHSQWLVSQHARVAIERIERTVAGAYANSIFPGAIRVQQQRGSWEFPDTLVVWTPPVAAANPDGLPLFSEVTIFTPDRDEPNRLIEITIPYDTRTVPDLDDILAWQDEIDDLKANLSGAEVVQLTDLLRTETLPDYAAAPALGAVRFEVLVRPSMTDWSDYEAGNVSWEDLPWTQDIRGSSTGLRQTWCRIEIQLRDDRSDAGAAAADTIFPFLGSSTIYYGLRK